MLREEDGFVCDMEVFENSGKNLAEYLLNRQGIKVSRRRLFEFDRDEESEEVSIRFVENHQGFPILQRNSPSSSSTSSTTFVRFKPSTASTPFPRENLPSCPRKIVSVSYPNAPQRLVSPEKTPKRNSRGSTQSSSISDPQSPHGNRRQITVNPQVLSPTPPCPPYADEPIVSSAKTVVENIRNISETMKESEKSKIQSIHEKSKQSKKTISVTEKPSSREVQFSMTDDEDDPDVPNPEVVQTNTNREIQRMSISEPPIIDLRSPQQKNDASSGFVDFSAQSSRTTANKPKSGTAEIATGNKSVIPELPEESTNLLSLCNQRSQVSLVPTATSTVTNDSGVFKAPLATGKRGRKKKKLDSPLARMIQLESSIRKSVPRELGVSKRKLYSKGSEEFLHEALVDDIGRKDSVSHELQQQQQELEVELDSDELMEAEAEVFDIANITQPCHIAVERINITNDLKMLTEKEKQEYKKAKKEKNFNKDKDMKKQKEKEEKEKKKMEKEKKKEEKDKKKKKEKKKEDEKPLEEQEENIPIRRSQRKRYAPMAFWLGAQRSPLMVRTYNEKIDLKKRYVKQGSKSTPVIKGDFTVLMEKKEKKEKKSKPRKKIKFYSAKKKRNNTKQTEVFEPQLDAELEERTQSPEKVVDKESGKSKRQKDRAKKLENQVEVHEKQSQLPNAKDKRNEKETYEKNDDQKRSEQSLASDAQSSVSVVSFGEELYNLSETDKMLGALVINACKNF
ncbi:histone-lysine N-methyltransferase, H3 lysine-79 specific-like isoform X2 [Phlebotomus papatasi]|uniref:histone-lysine N-methyltransferase, H3 lysine-79 specific-like isoform X2 n=1 Tax=Phlebotomus papatasi TaxID=29031 RepID=UPI0024836704|nr:histone-lysine N-methyltransferase, H3 lysine-79 specific-like isoform X2 [Phlebotomus papatasi]